MLERLFLHFVVNVVVKMLKVIIEIQHGFDKYLSIEYKVNDIEEFVRFLMHDFCPTGYVVRDVNVQYL